MNDPKEDDWNPFPAFRDNREASYVRRRPRLPRFRVRAAVRKRGQDPWF